MCNLINSCSSSMFFTPMSSALSYLAVVGPTTNSPCSAVQLNVFVSNIGVMFKHKK